MSRPIFGQGRSNSLIDSPVLMEPNVDYDVHLFSAAGSGNPVRCTLSGVPGLDPATVPEAAGAALCLLGRVALGTARRRGQPSACLPAPDPLRQTA